MKEKLMVISGMNLQQAIKMANSKGIQRDNLVGIYNAPGSREFFIVYWKEYESEM